MPGIETFCHSPPPCSYVTCLSVASKREVEAGHHFVLHHEINLRTEALHNTLVGGEVSDTDTTGHILDLDILTSLDE